MYQVGHFRYHQFILQCCTKQCKKYLTKNYKNSGTKLFTQEMLLIQVVRLIWSCEHDEHVGHFKIYYKHYKVFLMWNSVIWSLVKVSQWLSNGCLTVITLIKLLHNGLLKPRIWHYIDFSRFGWGHLFWVDDYQIH